jgi:hypothetical protein
MGRKGNPKRIIAPPPEKGLRFSAQESSTDYNQRPPIFSLERLQGGTYCLESLDQEGKAAFADAIFKRRKLSWNEIISSPRHGLGCEKISRASITAAIPPCITPDVDHFLALRFHGKKPMVGIRSKDVFYVLWFDHNYSVYPHS